MKKTSKAPAQNTQTDQKPSASVKTHSMFTRQDALLKEIELAERSADRRWFDDANDNPSSSGYSSYGPSSYGFNT